MDFIKLTGQRPDSERGLDTYKYFDMIKIDELKDMVTDIINEYGSRDKLTKANKVASVLINMLKYKKLVTDGVQQSYVDMLIASALMHNIFYYEEDWITLFLARQAMLKYAIDHKIEPVAIDMIAQTIESQLGENTPIPLLKPTANSPGEVFATAVWFVNNYEIN